MSTLIERIKEIRRSAGLSQAKFAKAVDSSPAMICYVERGERVFADAVLEKIARRFGVNYGWLKTGEGEMAVSKRQVLLDKVLALSDPEIEQVLNFLSDLRKKG